MKEVRIVIDDEFDYIRDFQNGFAAVKKAGKYSFINSSGELICDFLYDEVLNFSQNLAAVMINNKWGFIDTKAKVVVDLIYDDVCSFVNDYALLRQGNENIIIDTQANIILKTEYDGIIRLSDKLFKIKKGDVFALIDQNGNFLSDFEFLSIKRLNERLFLCKQKVNNKVKCGVLNEFAKLVLEAKFEDIGLINDEYLLVFDGLLYGLFDVNLNCIFEPMYKDVKFIAKDMIKVRVGTKYAKGVGWRVFKIVKV
ncbi:WG repeat-containing protein [Campylobacter peloridis]|uniref:WG repeat-containing protein n=1 Tax=Campylobacter peloridis TaxID=488546 RepID=UPI001C72B01A|nr:WG repeat-containing protein [Campylobacter peloridis]MBX2078875.1 WG repeat-containing protein [Campylobacter peloridis]